MKTSRYNYSLILSDGTTLFFNFYTLSLIALNPSESQWASKILLAPDQPQKEKKGAELRTLLTEHGFILDDGVDELECLKTQHFKSREHQGYLGLTIVPTLLCNFSCIYCYQDRRTETMNQEVADALIQFVKNNVVKNGTLSVTWFGGEPLLCIEMIERLSHAFIETCQSQEAQYSSNVITNGFLLNGKTAERLRELKISSAQITMDGPPNVHDLRRPLLGGGRTFNAIVNNIKEASASLGLNIRMNVDGRNRELIPDLFNVLEEEGFKGKVGFYLGQTYPYTTVCQDVSGWCLQDEDFSLLELETAMEMVNRGYPSYKIPKAKNYFCMADDQHAFAVTPTGGMVKCWNDVANPEMEIMNLLKPVSEIDRRNAEPHLTRNPFELECSSCHALPICMGGCPYLFKKTGQLHCHDWKHHPKENLLFYYYLKKMEQESEIAQAFWKLVESPRKQSGTELKEGMI